MTDALSPKTPELSKSTIRESLRTTELGEKLKKGLAEKIFAKRREISEWALAKARIAPPPFYCSVDLRDSGHKIVPVDSNLYPAGFNNICPEDLRTAPAVVRTQIEALMAHIGHSLPSRILVLPESHTSNTYYLENLTYLRQILVDGGFEVRIGWQGPMPQDSTSDRITVKSASGKELELFPMSVTAGVASAGEFVPDLILLNNDFSSGYPKELDAITQPILPSHTLGWHTRKKSEHFVHYNQLAREFAEIAEIDPWILTIDTEEVSEVDFNEDQGLDRVEASAARVLERVQTAYTARGISQKPFVFVKNNAGTYGMGIMVIHDAAEIKTLNRRAKNKMSVGKNRSQITSVAVQEGIPTATLVDRLAAEPVIYLVGGELIGGFLRTNTERGTEENLNSQGMVFRKLCMSDLRTSETEESSENELPVHELVYGSIARISALATGLELEAHPKPS